MQARLDAVRAFYNSRWYALLITALIFIGYTTETEVLCFLLMTASILVACFVAHDFRFAIMPFVGTVCFVTVAHTPGAPTYSDYYGTAPILPILIVAFGAILAGFAVFAIRNRKRANPFPQRGVFLSLVILSVALCLNGVFNSAYTVQNLAFAASFPLTLVVTFLLFSLFVDFKKDASEHFMFCMVLAGVLIVLQLAYMFACTDMIKFDEHGDIQKDSIVLGWAVHNSFAGLLTMLIPACFYFAATHRFGWIFYGLGLVELLTVVISQSRAATLVGGLIVLLCMIAVCFFGKNKRINRFLTAGVFAVGILGVVFLWDKISGLFHNLLTNGFWDNGRFEIWKTGIDQFLSHPIFGAGFYDDAITAEEVLGWNLQIYPNLYHNTLIQMLGAAGIVGLGAYLWHRFCTVRLALTRPSLYKSMLAIGLLALVLFSLLDVLFFITYPLLYYALFLVFMEKAEE